MKTWHTHSYQIPFPNVQFIHVCTHTHTHAYGFFCNTKLDHSHRGAFFFFKYYSQRENAYFDIFFAEHILWYWLKGKSLTRPDIQLTIHTAKKFACFLFLIFMCACVCAVILFFYFHIHATLFWSIFPYFCASFFLLFS